MPKNVQKPNQRSNKSTEPEIVHLSEKDGEALNSILAARATDSSLVPTIAGSRDRVVAMQQLLECLDDDPAPPPTDLVQRTLARVEEARQQHRFRGVRKRQAKQGFRTPEKCRAVLPSRPVIGWQVICHELQSSHWLVRH